MNMYINEYMKWGSLKISVNSKAYLFIGHHDTSRLSVTPDIPRPSQKHPTRK